MNSKIPVSVIVATRNEEKTLARCLNALRGFDEVIVVDSNSNDATCDIARSFGVWVVPFTWNGVYPKKRQWCLDTLNLKHAYVFFVDADEEVTPELYEEIACLDWDAAGYFIKGTYVLDRTPLRHGLKNNKLCLFDRHRMEFPVMDDLDLEGMGEIEGHYQPVLKKIFQDAKIRSLKQSLLHHALEDGIRWQKRHEGYAVWQKAVNTRFSQTDPSFYRRCLKRVFYALPAKPYAAFLHSYILLGGFMDGKNGLMLARSRYDYYRMMN